MEAITTIDTSSAPTAAAPVAIDLLHDLWPKIRLDVRAEEGDWGDFIDEASPLSVVTVFDQAVVVLLGFWDCGLCNESYIFEGGHFHSQSFFAVVSRVIERLINQQVFILRRCIAPDLATMPYSDYLKTEHWQKTSAAAKDRAGQKCQMCNAYGQLHTHHRTYERRGKELPEDLIVLCASCHKLFHDNGKLAKRR